MPKAVLHNGVVHLIEPLPAGWQDGDCLLVEKDDEVMASGEDFDRDFAELEQLCAAGDPAEDENLARALTLARELSKEQVRRSMERA